MGGSSHFLLQVVVITTKTSPFSKTAQSPGDFPLTTISQLWRVSFMSIIICHNSWKLYCDLGKLGIQPLMRSWCLPAYRRSPYDDVTTPRRAWWARQLSLQPRGRWWSRYPKITTWLTWVPSHPRPNRMILKLLTWYLTHLILTLRNIRDRRVRNYYLRRHLQLRNQYSWQMSTLLGSNYIPGRKVLL